MEIAMPGLVTAAGRTPAGDTAVLCAVLLACGIAAFAFTLFLACRRSRGQQLRRCPLCAADAVRAGDWEPLDEMQARVALQCGQCGTWRRVVTSHWAARGQDRRLEHDRRAIDAQAERLGRDRTLCEANAFVLALRRRIVGADDFLALTRPCGRSVREGPAR
jgi:hypothetical protein